MNRKAFLVGALVALTAISTQARPPASLPHTNDSIIEGLGERFPNSKDISLSPDFRVYKFKKGKVDYLQINTRDGEVLTAFVLTRSGAAPLPIGTLSLSQINSPAGPGSGMVSVAAECPCSGQLVYEDEFVRIVWSTAQAVK